MSETKEIESIIPKQALVKARTHEKIYQAQQKLWAGCSHNSVTDGALFQAYDEALHTLREDIDNIVSGALKELDERFWWEVFGMYHGSCKYAHWGICTMYHPNDGSSIACSYAFEHGLECFCIRTTAAEDAYPELFPELKQGIDTKGIFYGGEPEQVLVLKE